MAVLYGAALRSRIANEVVDEKGAEEDDGEDLKAESGQSKIDANLALTGG